MTFDGVVAAFCHFRDQYQDFIVVGCTPEALIHDLLCVIDEVVQGEMLGAAASVATDDLLAEWKAAHHFLRQMRNSMAAHPLNNVSMVPLVLKLFTDAALGGHPSLRPVMHLAQQASKAAADHVQRVRQKLQGRAPCKVVIEVS